MDPTWSRYLRARRRALWTVSRCPPPLELAPEDVPEPGSYGAQMLMAGVGPLAIWLAVNKLLVEYGALTAAEAQEARDQLLKAR